MKDAHYLIEHRFQGSSQDEIRGMSNLLIKKFHLPSPGKVVPHISLAGGLTTENEGRLIKDFVSICSKTPLCKYTVDGFGYFENETGVVFINIKPNENLKTFRWTLAKKIAGYCKLMKFDYNQDFNFHATLAMNLNEHDFSRLKKYIDTQPEPKYKQVMIRATILKNSRILCEYDFLQRRLLYRTEALSRRELTKTFHLLDEYFNGKYDPNKGIYIANKERIGPDKGYYNINTEQPQKTHLKQKSWISKIPFIGKLFEGR
jgi:2'-5' RNA ligase